MKKLLLFFCCFVTGLSAAVLGQTPQPKPKQTYLDLNTTTKYFSEHLSSPHIQEGEPTFAIWLGIPQKEIKRRKIRKITFNGERNEYYQPKEVGDYGGHNRPYITEYQVRLRLDTLPSDQVRHYTFNYEFNPNGQLLKADLPSSDNRGTIYIRRLYYPDGKLKENREIYYSPDRNRTDTLVRSYSGSVLTYNKAGQLSEEIRYNEAVETWYYTSYDQPGKKPGYYFETRRSQHQMKFEYDLKGKLIATRKYLLPDTGQTGQKTLEAAAFYFYDKSGKLQRLLDISQIRKESKTQSTGAFMDDVLYAYKGSRLHQVIKNHYSFHSAVPDTLLAAKGEIGPDTSRLESPYYWLVGSDINPGPHPFFKVFGAPDTVYYLQPGEMLPHYRNDYFRQDKKGRLDLTYEWTSGVQKRFYSPKLLEERTDRGRNGYECRFIWFNSKNKPKREIWIEWFDTDSERIYQFCENYPNEHCNTPEDLVKKKRIWVMDQRYQYRKDGLPDKITFSRSYHQEALRKTGESKPKPDWVELLLKPCTPCKPCENVKQLVKKQPEWPFFYSEDKIFTNFEYQYW